MAFDNVPLRFSSRTRISSLAHWVNHFSLPQLSFTFPASVSASICPVPPVSFLLYLLSPPSSPVLTGGAKQPPSCSFVPREISDDAGGGNPLCVLGGQQEDLFRMGQFHARTQTQRVRRDSFLVCVDSSIIIIIVS